MILSSPLFFALAKDKQKMSRPNANKSQILWFLGTAERRNICCAPRRFASRFISKLVVRFQNFEIMTMFHSFKKAFISHYRLGSGLNKSSLSASKFCHVAAIPSGVYEQKWNMGSSIFSHKHSLLVLLKFRPGFFRIDIAHIANEVT